MERGGKNERSAGLRFVRIIKIVTSYRRKMRTFNLIISQKKKIIEYEN